MKYLVLSITLLGFLVGFKSPASNTKPTEPKILVASKSDVQTVSEPKKVKKSKKITHVTLTCYQPVASQCNADCLHTADNSEIDLKKLKKGEIKWVAVSRDLLSLYPMGSRVKISDETSGKVYGIYQVKDKMNKRWNHRMDILIHPSSSERIYAENIKVELV